MPAAHSISQLLKRDGPWCHYCGFEIRQLDRTSLSQEAVSRDHILPRALGGSNEIENLRLAHKFCNSVRALGFTVQQTDKVKEKHRRFTESLAHRGYRMNPNFTGPANHTLTECPPAFVQGPRKPGGTLFFTLGPIAIDFKRAPGRYTHFRISLGSKHLVGAGYLNE